LALSPDEVNLLIRHKSDLDSNAYNDELMCRYHDGAQRIEQLGMAVPPSFRRFLLIVNWPGMYVESVESRQDVRSQILPGQAAADPQLDEIWDANNLDADLSLFLQDRYVYGRAFFSVGSNEDDPANPLIHVESPREMSAFVDVRRRRMTSAAKFYGSISLYGRDTATPTGDQLRTQPGPTNATLYLPDETVWAERAEQTGVWSEVDRDKHNLGRVPVTMSLCRRKTGSWVGTSLMSRVTGITDAAARALTNMQFASEAHGIPQRYALGVSQGDFVDADGKPLPAWEAYFNAVWANKNPNIKVGQFSASDLKNFETQLTMYGRLAGSVTLLPTRYFGLTTTNPPSADAIRAEEAQLVKFVERQNSQVGSVLGWTSALALRFANGDFVDGSRIAVEWHDPSTPTIAQREDALMKRRSVGVLSRQGYWDELGWSEQRKAKEQAYLDEEASADPVLAAARSLGAPVTLRETLTSPAPASTTSPPTPATTQAP
jgi:hypothetical protein